MSRTIRWAWVTVLVLALLMRLVALGSGPLSPDEADLALAALDAARSGNWMRAGDSPLLLVGNAGLFVLFDADAGLARLIPALAGVLLVGTPYFWRKRLGEWGALTAACLLLFSPLVLFVSRQLESTIIGVAAAALLLTATFPNNQDRKQSSVLAAVGIGLGLVGGASFYDLCIAGLIAAVCYQWLNEDRLIPQRFLGRAILLGAILALLISIGFGSRWSGWAGLAEGLSAWFSGWRASDGRPLPGALFFLYEPLTLLVALIGLVIGPKRDRPLVAALGVWVILSLLLIALRPGGARLAVSASVLPLALLGGYGLQILFSAVTRETWPYLGLHTLVGFLFWQAALLALARHTVAYSWQGWEFLGVFVVVLLQGLLAMVFNIAFVQYVAWRGLIAGILALFLFIQVGFGWGLTFSRSTSPLEPAVGMAASPDLRSLRSTVHDLSSLSGLREDTVRIALIDAQNELTDLVRWILRDFSQLFVISSWPEDADFVIAPETLTGESLAAPASDWQGIAFVATVRQNEGGLRCLQSFPPVCPDPLRWYLYRKSPAPLYRERIVLWSKFRAF